MFAVLRSAWKKEQKILSLITLVAFVFLPLLSLNFEGSSNREIIKGFTNENITQPDEEKNVLSGFTELIKPVLKKEDSKKDENKETFLVTRIIDGDTIELSNGQKVRYIGMDSPEIGSCYGDEAEKYNAGLVLNKQITMEKDRSETDRYGRLLRYVYAGDIFVNKEMIENGYARARSYLPDTLNDLILKKSQEEAESKQLGLWKACGGFDEKISIDNNDNGERECQIKGNISYNTEEKIYHLPDCPDYKKTKIDELDGEKWFCTEEEAQSLGWRKAQNCP